MLNPSYVYRSGIWKRRKGKKDQKNDGCSNGIWVGDKNKWIVAGNGSQHVNICGIKESVVVVTVEDEESDLAFGQKESLVQAIKKVVERIGRAEASGELGAEEGAPEPWPMQNFKCECPCRSGIKVGDCNSGPIGNGSLHINICNVRDSVIVVQLEMDDDEPSGSDAPADDMKE